VRARRRRWTRLTVGAVVLAVAGTPAWVSSAAPLAAAAGSTGAPQQNHLRLASQTPWVGPGTYELDLRLLVTTQLRRADVELAVTVYPRVRNRSEFALSVQDKIARSPLRTISSTLDQLAPDSAGAFLVRLPVRDPGGPPDPSRLNLSLPGAYPVQVELRQAGGGETLARFTTHLLYTPPPPYAQPAAPGAKLEVAWILPLSGPLSLQPDGTRKPPAGAYDAVQELVRAVDGHPGVPLVLDPNPETVEGLAGSPREGDRAALVTLARDLDGRQVVEAPYVPVSLKAFADAGLEGEAAIQLDQGRRVLADALHLPPGPRTVVVGGRLDDASLSRLGGRGTDRLVLPDTDLAPVQLRLTPASPFGLDSRGPARPEAVVADPGLAAHFGTAADPVLAAHQLMADLATIYFDNPGLVRGVVALTPGTWQPNRELLDAALDGLGASPILSPVTLDTLFDTVPAATLVRRLASGPSEASALSASAIRAARDRLDAFAPILDAKSPLLDAYGELRLVSESADLRPRQRNAYLTGLGHQIDRQLALVRLPSRHTITLTARTGEIPVTIDNGADHAIHVVVQVESDKLVFPAGSSRRIDLSAHRSVTERFPVRARATGAFPLRVSVASPDGKLVLHPTHLTVRSTAASGVGVVLSVAAGLVLLTWWAGQLLRGRRARNRRLVPA